MVDSLNRLDMQGAVLLLDELVNNQMTAPIPGVVVCAVLLAGIEVVLVDLAGGVPAVDEALLSVRCGLGCIESAAVEGIQSGGNPWPVRAAAHSVERLVSVGIRGEYDVVPVAPAEEVGAFEAAVGVLRGIQRRAIPPGHQIV